MILYKQTQKMTNSQFLLEDMPSKVQVSFKNLKTFPNAHNANLHTLKHWCFMLDIIDFTQTQRHVKMLIFVRVYTLKLVSALQKF